MPRVWQDYGNEAIRELYPTSRRDVDYVWGRLDPEDDQSMLTDNIGMDEAAIEELATYRCAADPYNDYDPSFTVPTFPIVPEEPPEE